MKTMKIVSNKTISKDVFIDNERINPLDFGTIVKLIMVLNLKLYSKEQMLKLVF